MDSKAFQKRAYLEIFIQIVALTLDLESIFVTNFNKQVSPHNRSICLMG